MVTILKFAITKLLLISVTQRILSRLFSTIYKSNIMTQLSVYQQFQSACELSFVTFMIVGHIVNRCDRNILVELSNDGTRRCHSGLCRDQFDHSENLLLNT